MKKILFFCIVLLLITQIKVNANTDSPYELISDGINTDGTTGLENPSFFGNDELMTEFMKEYIWPDMYKYNSSLRIGRDGTNYILWISLRGNIWYGNIDTWPIRPENVPGNTGYYLNNYTKIAFDLIFKNAEIISIINNPIPSIISPLYQGDYVSNDGIEEDDVIEIIGNNMIHIDLLSIFAYDNLGIKFKINKHPATFKILFSDFKGPEEYYADYGMKRGNAILPDNYYLGNKKSPLNFNEEIPLTKSKLLGGIAPPNPQPIDIENIINLISSPNINALYSSLLSGSTITEVIISGTIASNYFLFNEQLKKKQLSVKKWRKTNKSSNEKLMKSAIELNRRKI